MTQQLTIKLSLKELKLGLELGLGLGLEKNTAASNPPPHRTPIKWLILYYFSYFTAYNFNECNFVVKIVVKLLTYDKESRPS